MYFQCTNNILYFYSNNILKDTFRDNNESIF